MSTRRKGRKPWALVATLVTGWVIAAMAFSGCATRVGRDLQRYEFAEPHMGLPFRIVLYSHGPTFATNAAKAAFARIAELNSLLSDYEENSELSRLSRTSGSNQWIPLGKDLARVLKTSQEISRISNGAFDVTVGPFVQLWRRSRRQRELPDPVRLAQAGNAVGWQYVHLKKSNDGTDLALLDRPGMKLDLGGIAKGYALDETLKTLRQQGIRRCLIAGGGDLRVGDAPPNEEGWRIAVGNPEEFPGQPVEYVRVRNAALCTSGDVFQHVEIDGVRYSHIVHPKTGMGLTHQSLVTVIAPNAMRADALATALSVLGPEEGIPLVEASTVESARFVQKVGSGINRITSSRWERFTEERSSATSSSVTPVK